MKQYKIIVEKHPDAYVAYPLGIKGVIVGEGDTYEEALAEVRSSSISICRHLAKSPSMSSRFEDEWCDNLF